MSLNPKKNTPVAESKRNGDMKFLRYYFILTFACCLILLSCAHHLIEEIDLTQPPDPGEEVKLTKETAKVVANFVGRKLSLGSKQKRKFVAAYVAEREEAVKRQLEVRLSGNQQDLTWIYQKNEEGLLKVMKDTLNPNQRQKALIILRPDGRPGEIFGFLDDSVNRLIRGRVAKRKIKMALPILEKYHQQLASLTAKARSEGMVRKDTRDKIIELRIETAKKLAPIISEEAASFWLDLRRRSRSR